MDASRFAAWVVLVAMAAAAPAGAAVKLQVIEGRPVVDGVYVNGSGPYRFIIDTATSVNLVDVKLARSIGLTPTFRHELRTAAGISLTPGSGDVAVRLDSVQAGHQTFLFAGLGFLRDLSPTIKGVLGQSFLSRFDYLLDLRGKRLEFGAQASRGTRTALATVTERPAVLTNRGLMLLDSGADRVVFFGVGAGGRDLVETVAGPVSVGTTSGVPLVIEGRSIHYGEALTVPERNEKTDATGLLPVSLFSTVYVCNSEGYVVLE